MFLFSRDYIEIGTYLNQIFSFMGIRLVALNDHYDSRNHYGNTIEIDTGFRHFYMTYIVRKFRSRERLLLITNVRMGNMSLDRPLSDMRKVEK